MRASSDMDVEQRRAPAAGESAARRGPGPGKRSRSGEAAPEGGPSDRASSGKAGSTATGEGGVVDDWEMTPGLGSALGLGAPGDSDDAPEGAARVQRKAVSMPSWASTGQVQARGDLHGENTVAIAERGVASASSPLPHLDAIQRSFGKHDVSNVRAQIGGEAADASRAIGAEAYATGNRVAFSKSPDLHTAAHEAAHVVQQRAGVQLKGGVGVVGDQYERHADAVADLVVQGKSAQDVLEQYARPTGNAQSGSYIPEVREASGKLVQRTETGKQYDNTNASGLSWEAKLVVGFIAGIRRAGGKGLEPADMIKIEKDFKDPQSLFQIYGGYLIGVNEGALLSLWDNINGIVHIAEWVFWNATPAGALRDLYNKLTDPEGSAAREADKLKAQKDIVDGLMKFAAQLAANPNVLIDIGDGLGEAAGQYIVGVGEDFARAQPAAKGRMVGKGAGYVAMELALLLLGPEELAAKLPTAITKAARSGKAGQAILRMLEKVPELRKVLEAAAKLGKGAEAVAAEAKLLAHLEPAVVRKVLQQGLTVEEISELAKLEKVAAEKLLNELAAREVLDLQKRLGKSELERLAKDKTGDELRSIAGSKTQSASPQTEREGNRPAPAPDNYRGRYNAARRAEGKAPLPDDWDAHHRIPQVYRNHPEFKNFDFDAPANIQGIKGNRADVNVHSEVTDRWRAFQSRNPGAQRMQIEDFARRIDVDFEPHWWK